MTLLDIARMTEEEARELLESLRWPDGVRCAHCESDSVTKLNGKAHRAGLYKCKGCQKQFTVTVGTIFHRSKLPLVKWIMGFYLVCSSKKGLSALQLQRQLGIGSYRTAWHLCHRIREALANQPGFYGKMGGPGSTIEADETYIGGKPRRGDKRVRKSGRGTSKTPVVALIDRDGEVRVAPVSDVTGTTIKSLVKDNVDEGSRLCTDGFVSYKGLGDHFDGGHHTVNHSADEFVRGDIHVNTAESFFSLVKRQYHGAHHHYSPQHMGRYVAETAFRWQHRKVDDWERTEAALRRAPGVRLTYKPIRSGEHR